MYSLLTKFGPRSLLKRQFPIVIVSIVLAEFFYKFHSFVLECLAFLVTWFVIDAAIGLVAPDRRGSGGRDTA